MRPGARIFHSSPGRLRLKLPSMKENGPYFARLREALAALRGVESVETNPATASVLVIHSAGREELLKKAQEDGLFVIEDLKVGTASLTQRITREFAALDRLVKSATTGQVDLAGIAFLALIGFGAYQLYIGNLQAPAWYAAFWYAFNILLKSLPRPA